MKISIRNYTLILMAWLKTITFENTFLEILNVHAPVNYFELYIKKNRKTVANCIKKKERDKSEYDKS